MKRKRYSEEQIISILKEHEAGASVPNISRRHGIAENTIYRWKSKFGGIDHWARNRPRCLPGRPPDMHNLPHSNMLRLRGTVKREDRSPRFGNSVGSFRRS
jgi:hypothetical protein